MPKLSALIAEESTGAFAVASFRVLSGRCGRLRLPARRNSPHCRRQELCHQTKQVSYDLVRGAGGQLNPMEGLNA